MRDTISERSKAEGRITSRLPEFTPEEIKLLKGSLGTRDDANRITNLGSADFLGLNYYFGCKIRNRLPEEYTPDKPIDILESGYKASFDPSWKQ
jgi:beta-glucosidase/6-phospho-beta-glucosidase/beta-galactosidase